MTLARLAGLSMLTLAVSAPALAADCSESFSSSAIDEQLDEAMLAFASLDETGFLTAATRSAVMLPCVDATMTPSLAAAYHKVHSVRFFVSGQEQEALDSLRAAIGVDSGSTLSTRIAPEGGKLFRLQEKALANPATGDGFLESPDGLKMVIDGSNGNDIPSDAPSIVQLLDDGRLAWSGVVPTGGALPEEFSAAVTDLDPIDLGGSAAVGTDGIVDIDEPVDRSRAPREKKSGGGGPNGALLGAAGGSAAVAVGLFGVAALTRGAFNNNPSAGKYHIVNGTYWGSVGAGTAALALGGAAFISGGR